MDGNLNVFKKDPEVRVEITNMLDGHDLLLLNYQSKIGYDTLIQNVILKELINIMGTTISDLDIELKLKICRFKHPESNLLYINENNK